MNEFENKVRSWSIVTENPNEKVNCYRTFFDGNNFYVYRFVTKESHYRGNNYSCDGYVLAWADIQEYSETNAPAFVKIEE